MHFFCDIMRMKMGVLTIVSKKRFIKTKQKYVGCNELGGNYETLRNAGSKDNFIGRKRYYYQLAVG